MSSNVGRRTSGRSLKATGLLMAGKMATSAKVFLPVLAFLSVMTVLSELGPIELPPGQLIGIASITFLASGVYALLFGWGLNTIAPRAGNLRLILVVILYFTTEAGRAVAVAAMVYNVAPSIEVEWGYRILAGGATGILIFGISAVIANDVVTYETDLRNLRLARAKLEATTEKSEVDLAMRQEAMLETVRASVSDALAKVDTSESGTAAPALIRISEEVVRPLSHQLYDEMPQPPQASVEPQRASYRRIFVLATVTQPFQPALLATFAFFLMIGAALFKFQSVLAGFGMVAAMICWLVIYLSLASWLLMPLLPKLGFWLRAVILTLVYAGISVGPNLLLGWFPPNGVQLHIAGTASIYIIATFVGWTLALYPAAVVASSEQIAQIGLVNAELGWQVARYNTQALAQQRRVAKAIHKDVQGVLVASAAKLQAAVTNGLDFETALKEIEPTIQGLTKLIEPEQKEVDLRSSLDSLSELWRGVLEIDYDMRPAVVRCISADPVCSEAVVDFVTEFATNSIKHGSARRLAVSATQPTASTVQLRLRNDGDGLRSETPATAGIGMRLLASQCIEYSAESLEQGGVELTALLPLRVSTQ